MAGAVKSVRLLFAGELGGGEAEVENMFAKASKLHLSPKSGPFHALLIVGCSGVDASDIGDALRTLRASAATTAVESRSQSSLLPPVLIFCERPGLKEELETALRDEADNNAEDIRAMEGAGIVYIGRDCVEHLEIEGNDDKIDVASRASKLKLLYACGAYNSVSYAESAGSLVAAVAAEKNGELSHRMVQSAVDVCKPLHDDVCSVVDVLVTTQWPKGIAPSAKEKGNAADAGCLPVTELAVFLQPRYHIASSVRCHHAQDPYVNPLQHVTRFIGLGSVDGTGGKAWHAIGVEPAASSDSQELLNGGATAAASPYMSMLTQNGTNTNGNEDGTPDANGAGPNWRWTGVGGKRGNAALAGGGENGGGAEKNGKRARIADSKSAAEANSARLYVGNVSFDASDDDLRALFGKHGKVVEMSSRENTRSDHGGQPKGYVHVTMDNVNEAQKVLDALHGHSFKNRTLRVDIAERPRNAKQQQKQAPRGLRECCFCLGSSTADSSLVVSVGNDTYTALDKGGLAKNHALIVPIEHEKCVLTLSSNARGEVVAYQSALRKCFDEKFGCGTLFFERFVQLRHHGGNHAHVNAVPIPRSITSEHAREVIETAGKKYDINFEFIPAEDARNDAKISALVGNAEYVRFELPDMSMLVHVIKPAVRHQLSFCREAVAMVLGAPERADWKKCQLASPEDEAAAVAELKTALEPYDLMS